MPRQNSNSSKSNFKKRPSSSSRFSRKKVTRPLPEINYKDAEALLRFVTEKGKILPRRITKLSAKDQRDLKRVIKRSRHAGFIAFQAN